MADREITFVLTVEPAIDVEVRHEIEDVLEGAGFDVDGGGTMMDGSQSDITFTRKEEKSQGEK